jgi:hypothetical protein
MTPTPEPKTFRFLDTTAACHDVGKRALLERYWRGRLSAALKAVLEAHLDGCLACAIAAVNAETVARASRHHGVPVGPDLVRFLELVPIVQPCQGRKDPNWGHLVGDLRVGHPRRRPAPVR